MSKIGRQVHHDRQKHKRRCEAWWFDWLFMWRCLGTFVSEGTRDIVVLIPGTVADNVDRIDLTGYRIKNA